MSVFDFKADDIKGNEIDLNQFRGKKLLIVNTASDCVFTPQYEGLENLYKKYQDQLVVLAFPCNQFGKQEQKNNDEIAEFCDLRFKTSFPLFAKVEVNGDGAHPLFKYAKNELPGLMGSTGIKWNFTKFLFSEDGRPLKRYAPKDSPEKIEHDLKKMS